MSQTELYILPRSYPINNSTELPAFLYWKNLLEKFLMENFIFHLLCCVTNQKVTQQANVFLEKKYKITGSFINNCTWVYFTITQNSQD